MNFGVLFTSIIAQCSIIVLVMWYRLDMINKYRNRGFNMIGNIRDIISEEEVRLLYSIPSFNSMAFDMLEKWGFDSFFPGVRVAHNKIMDEYYQYVHDIGE